VGSRFPGEHTLVTVDFKDAPGGTEVIITHENFSTTEAVNPHKNGWEGCLASLENFLKK
jgi:Activator of Hsp90 ATPase homolog 1-like protein